MKLLMVILTTLMVLFSTNTFAGNYVGQGTITTMQNAYGGWIIKTNGLNNNPDGCSSDIIILQNSHGQYMEVYSLLLSAYTIAKPVNIFVDGCDVHSYKKFSFVHSVWNE